MRRRHWRARRNKEDEEQRLPRTRRRRRSAFEGGGEEDAAAGGCERSAKVGGVATAVTGWARGHQLKLPVNMAADPSSLFKGVVAYLDTPRDREGSLEATLLSVGAQVRTSGAAVGIREEKC